MPKYYTTIRVTVQLHRKIIRARGKLEIRMGEKHTIENVLEKAIDGLLAS